MSDTNKISYQDSRTIRWARARDIAFSDRDDTEQAMLNLAELMDKSQEKLTRQEAVVALARLLLDRNRRKEIKDYDMRALHLWDDLAKVLEEISGTEEA